MTQHVYIEGMNCDHCAMTVKEALGRLEGVSSVEVDLKDGVATVESVAPVSTDAYFTAVASTGYTPVKVEE